KTRRRTNKQEQAILESSFKINQRPDIATRESLAKELGMSTRAIQIWFQNKRQTLKK
ncbi:Homeodomain-like protein, partial [Basidiobolus meristosporus CBS 931.73]